MLRTLLVGVAGALIGERLLRMNREGRFDEAKAKVKARVKDRLGDRLESLRATLAGSPDLLVQGDAESPRRPARPPRPAAKAHPGAPDDVSRPARAAPWPADKRALTEER